MVGENGSGKTTVVDAMRYVLLTQSGEFVRPMEDDFNVRADGVSARELRIECVIAGLGANEAKNFIEYLTVEGQGEEACHFTLRLYYRAWREGNRVFTDLRVGALRRPALPRRCGSLGPLRRGGEGVEQCGEGRALPHVGDHLGFGARVDGRRGRGGGGKPDAVVRLRACLGCRLIDVVGCRAGVLVHRDGWCGGLLC